MIEAVLFLIDDQKVSFVFLIIQVEWADFLSAVLIFLFYFVIKQYEYQYAIVWPVSFLRIAYLK